jgi:RimJ/RimL family protein N-acetyltransferase
MTPILVTERLRLRAFRQDDLYVLAAMVADEDQMRFYPRPRTRAEAAAWISRNLDLYENHGLGIWLVESLRASAFLGYCGLRPVVLEGVCETEIGWHVRKGVWNQGIATEAAMAVSQLAVSRFGLARFVAIVHPDNRASRRVAENIGMHDERTTIFESAPAVIYATEPRRTVASAPASDAAGSCTSTSTCPSSAGTGSATDPSSSASHGER